MKIGVIGYGVVGEAVGESLKEIGHEIFAHDIVFETTIEDVLNTELCFLCVPTPKDENGQCDISVVEEVIKELDQKKLMK